MRERPDLVSSQRSVQDRGADSTAPRSTPLTLVAGAVAGGDLQSVASTAAEALRRPVVIAIPALGAPVLAPPDSLPEPDTDAILKHAGAVIAGVNGSVPDAIAEAVPVQIGDQVVGIVVAAGPAPPSADGAASSLEQRAWLEAAAAAASVTALIRETHGAADSAQALLTELAAAPPHDQAAFLARARRLGYELSSGAVAICGWSAVPGDGDAPPEATEMKALSSDGGPPALMASRPGGRILALVPLTNGQPSPAELAERLHELEQLRDHTITPLSDYDAHHDTELLATLHAFLAHDGSTTETADAMSLHRHTVGYRLSRVHEVSGLSPYESDGRERLSLGIKAHEILNAEGRRR
jgi:hypothetical protein